MTRSWWLDKNGIDPDEDVSELSREEARERAVETAYYKAALSDSTHHGINHGAKVNVVSNVVKNWPQFGTDDFCELDDAVDEIIDERRS